MAKKENKKPPKLPELGYGEGNMSYIAEKDLILFKKSIGENGYKKRVSVYGKTVTECFLRMEEKERELKKDIHEEKNQTLYDAMLEWLEERKKPKLKQTSYETLKKTIRTRIGECDIGTIRYNQITTRDIEIHLKELKYRNLSYSSIKKCYDALNAFYKYCVLYSKIDRNPMDRIETPEKKEYKPPKDIEWLNSNDIELFCNQAVTLLPHSLKPQYQYGFCICANIYMGLRVAELLALTWEDVDFDKNLIYITKQLQSVENPEYDENNKEKMKRLSINKHIFIIVETTKNYQNRIIPLNSTAKHYLFLQKQYSSHTNPKDFICCTRDGRYAQPNYIQVAIGKIEKRAGTECRASGTHVIRHTCASLYYEKGVPTEIIASILGHSVEVCRATYIHFENMRKAKESAKIVNDKLAKKQLPINNLGSLKIEL